MFRLQQARPLPIRRGDLGKILLIIVLLLPPLLGQTPRPRPRIGLALSGGGAKGFAHIGVLKVLEEIGMPIDGISGTSMGSIVGGLYAIGYRAAELEDLALNSDWNFLLSDQVDRSVLSMEQKFYDARYNVSLDLDNWHIKLPSGLIAGQNVLRLLDRLTLPVQHIDDFTRLPIPFVCVATNIVSGEAEVLRSGSLPEAIRASMAIPSLFTPIKIDSLLLVDGMIARNFPVQEAIEILGADTVIGVDVGEELASEKELNSFVSIINQAVSFQMARSTAKQRALCDFLIVPDLAEYGAGDFNKAAYFIAQGEQAAREKLPELRALAESLRGLPPPPRIAPPADHYRGYQPGDSIFVAELDVVGLDKLPANFVRERLKMEIPGRTVLEEIEAGIDRIYGSQFFERVSYELLPANPGKKLRIRVIERSNHLFRIGFRFDSKREAALLLNTTFRNLGRSGSFLTFDLKLGSDVLFDGQYFTRTGFRRLIGWRWRLLFARRNIDQFSGDDRIARQRVSTLLGEGLIGTIFSNKFALGGGIRGELARINPTIAPLDFLSNNERLLIAFASLFFDSYNRSVFPTSGLAMEVSTEFSDRNLLSEHTFQRYFANIRAAIPLNRSMSLLGGVFLGNALGDVPFHYLFMLGGMDTPFTFLGRPDAFLGFRSQEFTNRNAQFGQIGLQYEIWPNKFLILRANSGNTFDTWSLKIDPERYFFGGGVTLATNTRLGPVEFTAMSSQRHGILTHLNIGYKF